MSLWVAVAITYPWFWGEPQARLLSQRGWETKEACEQVLAVADPDGLAQCQEIKVR